MGETAVLDESRYTGGMLEDFLSDTVQLWRKELDPQDQPCAIKCSYYAPDEERPITRRECRTAKSLARDLGLSDIGCGAAALLAVGLVRADDRQVELTQERDHAA